MTRNVLRKAITSLADNSYHTDDKVTSLLNNIKTSSNIKPNLDILDSQLDELTFLTNNPDRQHITSNETEFSLSLKNSLDGLNCSQYCMSSVSEILGKNLSDKEMSLELLRLIDQTEVNREKSEGEGIKLFIKDLADSVDFKYLREDPDAPIAMHDIVIQLSKYIFEIKRNGSCVTDINQSEINNHFLSLNSLLVDMVNQLSLPKKHRKQQLTLLKMLNNPIDSDEFWNNLIDKIALLVNETIISFQLENNDLHGFISKINKQLSEIKLYLERTRQDKKEAITRSADLEETVITSVSYIQEKVSSANDVKGLKKDIAYQLKDIRKSVEENKLAEKEKEEMAVHGFSNIMSELNSAQMESARLKAELEESKGQLLRDSLTGLYNRLAYEERVIVENSRRKRSKTPLCLAIWDIDHFKNVNDSYGHDVGVRVL
jgi:hypothetical protein